MAGEQTRSEIRRERILEAALSIFARRGYRDAAMDDIAAASDTSKGGVYFHFPNKQAIFLSLLDRMAALLMTRAEAAIAAETDSLAKMDAALRVVLDTFSGHRSLARLFLVDALGAGREFNTKMLEIHREFAGLIARHLDEGIRRGDIAPVDTRVAGLVWFGAINEVVTDWLLDPDPPPLESYYPTLRALLRRSVGMPSEGPEGDVSWPSM